MVISSRSISAAPICRLRIKNCFPFFGEGGEGCASINVGCIRVLTVTMDVPSDGMLHLLDIA